MACVSPRPLAVSSWLRVTSRCRPRTLGGDERVQADCLQQGQGPELGSTRGGGTQRGMPTADVWGRGRVPLGREGSRSQAPADGGLCPQPARLQGLILRSQLIVLLKHKVAPRCLGVGRETVGAGSDAHRP